MVIYRLIFSTGKCYIGQTTRKLSVRISVHRQAMRAGSMLPVHCAWRMHGAPVVEVLSEHDSQESLHSAEIEAIRAFDCIAPNGYNLGIGGGTAPSKTPEVAAKIAAKAKGRSHTQATKDGMSASSTSLWADPKYREKVSASLKAAWTPEMRAAASERMTRIKTGTKMSDAAKAKISLSKQNMSAETRMKMSESAKRRGPPLKALEASLVANKGKKRGAYSDDRVSKAAAGVKAAWQDPEKRERLMDARKAAWVTRRAKTKTELTKDYPDEKRNHALQVARTARHSRREIRHAGGGC